MEKQYSVKLGTLIDEFQLEVLRERENYRDVPIVAENINRPGLQLGGFFVYFDPNRLQLIGRVETTYMEGFSPEKRREMYGGLLEKDIPALIFTRKVLSRIPSGSLIIDLASAPGGVDREAADKLDIKVIQALSLPGKVAPKAAGEIIKETIYNIMEE